MEYKVVEFRRDILDRKPRGAQLKAVLNEHGQQGWRAASIVLFEFEFVIRPGAAVSARSSPLCVVPGIGHAALIDVNLGVVLRSRCHARPSARIRWDLWILMPAEVIRRGQEVARLRP
jgi:hypothetical protein